MINHWARATAALVSQALRWDPSLTLTATDGSPGHRLSVTWRDVGVEDGLTFNSDERLGLMLGGRSAGQQYRSSMGFKSRQGGGGSVKWPEIPHVSSSFKQFRISKHLLMLVDLEDEPPLMPA